MTRRIEPSSNLAAILPFLIGVLAGIGLALALLMLRSENSAVRQRAERIESVYREPLESGERTIETAETYLDEVMAAIRAKSQSDPGFLKATKTFIALKDFDAELAGRMPTTLPGFGPIVRADGKDAKVLMNWRLCGIAQIFRPALLDPVRSNQSAIGCPLAGKWTEGAAKW